MTFRFFSDKNRPVRMGPYQTERLARQAAPSFDTIPPHGQLSFYRPDDPAPIVNAMGEHQAMLDTIRDGLINRSKAECPLDPTDRANHLKAFGYFADAAIVGTCLLPAEALLTIPFTNPDVDRLAANLRTSQTKTLAAGIDLVMADLKESMEAAPPASTPTPTGAAFWLRKPPS